jgi:hypothetical protein
VIFVHKGSNLGRWFHIYVRETRIISFNFVGVSDLGGP